MCYLFRFEPTHLRKHLYLKKEGFALGLMITKIPEVAKTYVCRPGIDHVKEGSNRVCLSFELLSTAGAGDESKVDIRNDTIISRANGEFAWGKLINVRQRIMLKITSLFPSITLTP